MAHKDLPEKPNFGSPLERAQSVERAVVESIEPNSLESGRLPVMDPVTACQRTARPRLAPSAHNIKGVEVPDMA